MKNKTFDGKKISLCGIMAAFVVILGVMANVLQFNTLFFLVAMSLVMCIVTQKVGVCYALCTSIVSSILLFVFTWNKIFALEYLILFGTYPVVKYVIESKIKNGKAEKTAKALFYLMNSAIIVFMAEFVFGGKIFWGDWYDEGWLSAVICFAAITVLEMAYDMVLSYAIYLFNKKFNGRLFK